MFFVTVTLFKKKKSDLTVNFVSSAMEDLTQELENCPTF